MMKIKIFGFFAVVLFFQGMVLSQSRAQVCNNNGVCEPGLGEQCEGGINNAGNACADCFNINEEQAGGFQCTAGISCPITDLCSVDPTTGMGNNEDCVDCNPCTTAICQPTGINGQCVVTLVSCNATTPDQCCPAACTSGEDIDCPQSATVPPPTTFGADFEGSGCALYAAFSSHGASLFWMAGLATVISLSLWKGKKRR